MSVNESSKSFMNIFHLLNRGVEKRKIFLTFKDYLRFAHNLSDFNNTQNTVQSYYRRRNPSLTDVRRPSDKLVDILSWCLLPNHPHIMVMEKFGGGASMFSKKIFGGYTKYFNEQNQRSGVLFQGRSKIILVKNETHFLYLSFYIHLNPLDLYQPDWREAGIKNLKKAIEFLTTYRWSSYSDITGKENFSEIINKKLFFELFDTNEEDYKKNLIEWLENYRRNSMMIEGLSGILTDVRRPSRRKLR